MTEKLTHRMRWKAHFYLNPNQQSEQKETYGFKTKQLPPFIKEMSDFESKITEMIQNIKFKPYNNELQRKLLQDTKTIQANNKILVKADKTTNFYRLENDEYSKMLQNNVTKTYKKADKTAVNQITSKDKEIAHKLGLERRIETIAEKQPFITLKDHKDNFTNHPTCRLINPTKSEIGKISKTLLTGINKKVTRETSVKLWRSTGDVLNWFREIKEKQQQAFITFDVCEFYPSITEALLKKALHFASNITNITEDEKAIILHAKRSLVFHNDTAWSKKNSNKLFDVTMGSYDGAETCELVGTYLLTQLPKELTCSIGLYRDDGLAVCKGTPQAIEKTKKLICNIFNKNNLKITIEANKRSVNFLDVTLNLQDGSFKPFQKPGNTILYVHKQSNHPPSILKNLPDNINKRLNALSSDEQQFNSTVQPYQEALHKSGYNNKLQYETNMNKPKKRNRQRKITWYNPPFSANVATNIGQNCQIQYFEQN